MSWTAVIESASGRLVSLGTLVADPLPKGYEAVQLAGPAAQSEMWDPATRAFVARPAKVLVDRLDDLAANPDFVLAWQALNVTQRAALRRVILLLLGGRRFRNQREPVSVDA